MTPLDPAAVEALDRMYMFAPSYQPVVVEAGDLQALIAAWRDAQILADQNKIAFNHNADISEALDQEREKVHRLERALRGLLVLRENTDMTYESAYDAMFKSAGDEAWDAGTAALKGSTHNV